MLCDLYVFHLEWVGIGSDCKNKSVGKLLGNKQTNEMPKSLLSSSSIRSIIYFISSWISNSNNGCVLIAMFHVIVECLLHYLLRVRETWKNLCLFFQDFNNESIIMAFPLLSFSTSFLLFSFIQISSNTPVG